jgi:GNAT superfamily N-acetyltransferase
MEIALQKPQGMNDWLRLQRLYFSAFPADERKPFAVIRRMYREGKAHVWCILADGRFAGLATTVNSDDLIMIDYFAVSKSLRGRGVGRTAMECLLSMYEDKGVFLEIESTDRPGLDREQRIRRKEFYCSCGFTDLGVRAKVFGVYMELLGIRCQMDFDGYKAFYRDNYSGWASDHLEKVK